MKNFHTQQSGYTLAEAIVAIGILSSALLGTLILAVQSINVTDIAQTKTQAEFLAEEGIELARAFRENTTENFVLYDLTCGPNCSPTHYVNITGPLVNDGASQSLNIDGKYRVCLISDTGTDNCSQLYIDPTKDNRYVLRKGSNTPNTPTRFTRTITFTRKFDSHSPDPHPFIEVTSKVDFVTRGTATASTYQITTDFYDGL